jgi:phenylpropionate dioxygenase-like ring-hydroxylating dioxygenase large terminal subunit
MSSSLGPLIDRNEMTIQANWKILVENTLESYHVDFVHANSFKLLGAKGSNFKFDSPHSSWETSIDEKVQRKLKKVLPVFESRPFSIDGYLHQLVFPNLTIATTNGTSFSIQLFDPISPSETAFTSWVFQTKIDAELTAAQGHVVTALNASVKDFNRRVFAEDKEVCEQVQLGTQQTQQTGMLSDEELRVAAFQKEYIARLESVATSDAVEAPTGKLSQPQTSVSRKG